MRLDGLTVRIKNIPYYEEVIFMKEKARAMANSGYSVGEIATALGVTEFVVCRLLGKDY